MYHRLSSILDFDLITPIFLRVHCKIYMKIIIFLCSVLMKSSLLSSWFLRKSYFSDLIPSSWSFLINWLIFKDLLILINVSDFLVIRKICISISLLVIFFGLDIDYDQSLLFDISIFSVHCSSLLNSDLFFVLLKIPFLSWFMNSRIVINLNISSHRRANQSFPLTYFKNDMVSIVDM